MKIKILILSLFLCFTLTIPINANTLNNPNNLEEFAQKVLSDNPTESVKAISELRAAGQNGLDALLKVFSTDIKRHLDSLPKSETSNNWIKIRQAIESVSRQRDAHASGLYWYTDLEEAKAAAKIEEKPILSLRLLGNLDEELSCANSRFFRIVLYSNSEISKYLRGHYILHWKSVRPVPKMTIDFGDGRKMERTITGNSIHYILDSQGNVLDALPGMNSPKAFFAWLNKVEPLAKFKYDAKDKQQASIRFSGLRTFHSNSINDIGTLLLEALSKTGEQTAINTLLSMTPKAKLLDVSKTNEQNQTSQNNQQSQEPSTNNTPPTAMEAAPRAITKMVMVEAPLLRQMTNNLDDFKAIANDTTWNKLANLYISQVEIDQNSQKLMTSKNMDAYGYRVIADGVEPMSKTLENFSFAIAKDSVFNEYFFHIKIHQMLMDFNNYQNLEALNEKIYSELFLTPKSDPWLGLKPNDIYSAIENDGLVK